MDGMGEADAAEISELRLPPLLHDIDETILGQ